MQESKKRKAASALDFMRNHPGFCSDSCGDSLFDGAWFFMADCCKHGRSYSGGGNHYVNVYRGDRGWTKYRDLFEKEYGDEYKDKEKKFVCVDVPYERYYGHKWKFDHVEYWYETSFWVFGGNPYSISDQYNTNYWCRYQAENGKAMTFEDMIIQCANKTKKNYGNFAIDKHFVLDCERKNWEDQHPILSSPPNPNGTTAVNFNNSYVSVHNGLQNLRWLKWYTTTEHCKKNWHDNIPEFEACIKNIDTYMPPEREAILKKYR